MSSEDVGFAPGTSASRAPCGVNESKKAPSVAAASRWSWECSATQYPSARSGAVVGPPSRGGLCTWTLTPGTSRRFVSDLTVFRSNVVLPGTKRCSFQKSKTSARKPNAGPGFGQVGVVVNPRAHDSLDPVRAQRTGEPRRGVGVPAAVQAPDGEHGHDDAVPSARSHRTPAPVALTLGRFRVQRGPLAVHGLELLEPADPPALPRGRIVV
jgi:hypothetical protein